MIYATPGQTRTVILTGAPAGIADDLRVRVMDPPATVVVAEAAGAVEGPAGVYSYDLTTPAVAGSYLVVWRNAVTGVEIVEELEVGWTTPASLGTPPGALATREQLERRLRTVGAAGSGAALDPVLLDELLEAASERIEQARPERTLTVVPPLEGDPPGDTGDPVTLTFPIQAPQRVVQVPDLRELVSAELAPAGGGGAQAQDVTTWQLRRRPRELCALWVKFPYPLLTDGELRITGRWGPAGAKVGTPPAELRVLGSIRDAALVWAARGFHNRTSRYADTVQTPDGGVANYFRNLPPDVAFVVNDLGLPGV